MNNARGRAMALRRKVFLLCGILLFVLACNGPMSPASPAAFDVTIAAPATPPAATPQPLTAQQAVLLQALQVVNALKNQDMPQLATLAHPIQGVRFSPYAYVQNADLAFMPEQLAGLLADPTIYEWGAYDGSGEPIRLSFVDYFRAFVFDHDYTAAEAISLNARLGYGNSIDNSHEIYPGAMVVEFHFSGFNPDFQGMDWASLRLVFQEFEGRWVLVGVIHDQWTI